MLVYTHPITRRGAICVCPTCGWRAVVTRRGLIVIRHGDRRVLHPVEPAEERGDVALLPSIEAFLRSL